MLLFQRMALYHSGGGSHYQDLPVAMPAAISAFAHNDHALHELLDQPAAPLACTH